MTDFLINWAAATPSFAAPLLLACLGLIVNERAGVLNLGAEGIMAMGAMTGAIVSLTWQTPVTALLCAILAGAALAALFGVATVFLRTNQVVTGLIIVALGAGLTGLIGRSYISDPLTGFNPLDLGFLSGLPVVGPILFEQNALTYATLALTPLVWFVLFRSLVGLRLRAVGEDPATADAAGVDILLTRLAAVIVGGCFLGAAGGYLALASSQIWVEGMVAGRGWIAIGLVIFARWRPGLALVGALLFGAIEALIPRVQASGADVPIYLMMMLPYLAALGVLVLANMRRNRGIDEPANLGQPYARQDRH